jgi:rubrerythrin
MSTNEENCPTCGKNPCACGGKSKTTINVSLTEEMKRTIEENALLKERLKDSEANQLATNEALAAAEKTISDAEEKRKAYIASHPPMGKSTNPDYGGSGGGETFKDRKELIDALYDRAYHHPQNFTKEEVEKAKSQIGTLWETYIDSPSRKTLTDEGIGALGRTHFMACPKCSYTVDLLHENVCSHCGYSVKGEDLKSMKRGS